VLASLSLLSFRPGRPITDDMIEAASAIAGQAALAVDNARLYAQQKEFADTMQRSLLPRSTPELPGLDVGEVYESAARVDVGSDTDQEYAEVRTVLPAGAAAVLYTDGVIEARQDGELYGTERLDALLSTHRELSSRELARAVVADCRAFAGGELADDCAVVVI